MQKKTLVDNLKTNKKAIVASKSTDAKVSAKITPRAMARKALTRVTGRFQ